MRKLKKIKILSVFFCILIFITCFSSNPVNNINSEQSNQLNLVLDEKNYEKLPEHFRTTSDLSNLLNKNLNLKGLAELNISGSKQFSKSNLNLVIDKINSPYKITDIDLRQESHGFINELPVSWENKNDNANIGLNVKQITLRENNLLKSIKLNEPITFYNYPDITVTPKVTYNEENLIKSKGLYYKRIPVTDFELPSNETVDYFLKYINSLPKESWLHFHCKEGVGRTTTFMIMYDIYKNYNNASLNEIIQRQLALVATFKPETDADFTNPQGKEYKFLSQFYKYCKVNGKDLNPIWSDWIKLNG